MRYYVISDPHAFYDATMRALAEAGFFEDKGPCRLVILGDLLDRGGQAVEMQNFAAALLDKGQLIFVKGNHEDLMERMLDDIDMCRTENLERGRSYHITNGTFDTGLQLTGMSGRMAPLRWRVFLMKMQNTPYLKKLIPAAVNYYETKHYVFVHGWIPVLSDSGNTAFRINKHFFFNEHWRNASEQDWANARWYNGMDFAHEFGIADKTVVCGHYHASYGHRVFEQRGSEYGVDADFSPYYGRGIIAMDACTYHSGRVNCIVIEDEEL